MPEEDVIAQMVDLARRVNRVERWIEQFRYSNRKVKNLVATDVTINGVLYTVLVDGQGNPIVIKDNLVPDTIETVGEAGNRFPAVYGNVADFDSGFRVTATKGLGANFHREGNPVSQQYPAGVTNIANNDPANGYHSILPARWTIPAKVGDVQPAIAFIFNDDSFVVRVNGTAAPITETREDVEFNKDGLVIKRVNFDVDNLGVTQTVDIGNFMIEGEQV